MRVDLREQIAVALNPRSQLADPVSQREAKIGALAGADELGALLWRMKYGRDLRPSIVNRAVLLFAKRARSAKSGRRGLRASWRKEAADAGGDIIDRVARLVVCEWVDDRCRTCSGRGTVGGGLPTADRSVSCKACSGSGRWRVRVAMSPERGLEEVESSRCSACGGRGRVDRAVKLARLALCPGCGGNGRRRIEDAQRAVAIGVSLMTYRRHWVRVVGELLGMLDRVDDEVGYRVRQELGQPQRRA